MGINKPDSYTVVSHEVAATAVIHFSSTGDPVRNGAHALAIHLKSSLPRGENKEKDTRDFKTPRRASGCFVVGNLAEFYSDFACLVACFL